MKLEVDENGLMIMGVNANEGWREQGFKTMGVDEEGGWWKWRLKLKGVKRGGDWNGCWEWMLMRMDVDENVVWYQ